MKYLVAWLSLWSVSVVLAEDWSAHTVRIVTLGDSITKGVRAGVKEDETFSALLQASLKQNGIRAEVRNVGIGGERTDQALKRLETAVLTQQPHLVTVMYGTNDSWVDEGKTECRLSMEAYEANLRAIVEKLKAAKIQPVLMTEPMFGEDHRKNGMGEEANLRITRYMEKCRAVAKELEVPLVDHFGHWAHAQKRKQKLQDWTTDGCHPNPAGHAVMGHRVVQVVLPLAQKLADEHEAWRPEAAYRVQLDVLSQGYDGTMCWVHPRAGIVDGPKPSVMLTMQKLLLTGSDVFYALNDMRSDDLGKTWSPLKEHQETLGRRNVADGTIVATCDFTPQWHAKTGKLLGVGQTVYYKNDKGIHDRSRQTSYAVYDAEKREWSPWATVEMPQEAKFFSAGAGSIQRLDLENGDVLVPIYFKGEADKDYSVTVMRCSFDGKALKFIEQGNELTVKGGRGLCEPSLIRCGKLIYLTMRNDTAGYVSTSSDGLHFSEPKKWTWQDGSDLENYNTQQHWVTHPSRLYLVYTRKGSWNDHVFRHRAPLFMAEVDQEKLCVLRDTERILMPENGARLGNFGVVQVNEDETWVTDSEWMQTWGPEIVIPKDNAEGADNRVYAARIRWTK